MGSADSARDAAATFAVVNGEPILQQTFEAALRTGARQRFYHGRAPEEQFAAFREEVAQRLIDERLMHQEAVRRGIKPDAAWVEAELAKLEQRYSSTPQWQEDAAALKVELRAGLEDRSRVARLEEQFRNVANPTEQQLRTYYEANPDKFTSPEQVRVTSILLKVEPYEPQTVWDARKAEAEALHAEILGGASFDELAQAYATEGAGDMGYLHRGMLGEIAQNVIDKLGEGEVSEVVTLLEGVAIFRLDDRLDAKLNPLSQVRERATELWLRERRDAAYAEHLTALRSKARIEYSEPRDEAQPPGRGSMASGTVTAPEKAE